MISGLIALACLVLLVIMIPNEIWGLLLYLGLILLVGFIGFWSLMFFIASL